MCWGGGQIETRQGERQGDDGKEEWPEEGLGGDGREGEGAENSQLGQVIILKDSSVRSRTYLAAS